MVHMQLPSAYHHPAAHCQKFLDVLNPKDGSAMCAEPVPSRYTFERGLETVEVVHARTQLAAQQLV